MVENVGGSVAPANVTTSYGYDRRGLLTSITDPTNRSRSYNAAGWQTGETDGLNRTTSYGYDRAGRVTIVSDPRPVTVSYAYDSADRLTGISAPNLTGER